MVDSIAGQGVFGTAPFTNLSASPVSGENPLGALADYLFGAPMNRSETNARSGSLGLDAKSQQALSAAREFLDSILEDDEFAHLVLTAVLGRSATEKALNAANSASGVKKTVELNQLRDIVKRAKAEAKAQAGGILAKIFKWIAIIIAAIGAAFAVVVSGGAATPVMACLIAGMVLALWDLGSEVASEITGDSAKGFAWAMGEMLAGVVKAFGGSEEEVENARGLGGMILAIVIQVTIGLVGVTGLMKGLSKGVEKASDGANAAAGSSDKALEKITDLVRTVMVTTEVAESVAMVGSGASNIHLAVLREKVAQAQADELEANALLTMILDFFETKKEELEEEMKKLQEVIAGAGKVKDSQDSAVAEIIENWSRPAVLVA